MTSPGHLFLSPHLDDAVWSCGGRIAHLTRRGAKVVVATVFSGLLDQQPNDGWRRIANNRFRANENRAALRVLGAESLNLGFIEAALRRKRGEEFIYPTLASVLNSEYSAGESILPFLVGDISLLLLDAWESINVPVAIGTHVDHALVRRAAEQATDKRLTYYEDFPYVFDMNLTVGLTAGTFDLAEEDLHRWLEAGRLYRSQVLWLFKTPMAFQEAVIRRAAIYHSSRVRYAERTWSVHSEFSRHCC